MSDTSQGPGWWRASNGKWYPPEARPGPKRPPGVPEVHQPDPKVQQPFTPRRDQSLERDRERERRRQSHRTPNSESSGRKIPWGWIGLGVLVLAFGGVGTWLALTAGEGDDETADATSTTVASDDTDSTQSTEDVTVVATDEVSTFDLVVGDCFTASTADGDNGPLVTTAEVVDCDEPHLAEVILIDEIDAADGAPFPGAVERDDAAELMCQSAFEDYIGVPLAASELGLLWLVPTEESWTEQDDRVVTCAVQSIDGEPLTGSVEGSER